MEPGTNTQQQRRPESVLASDAEKRASTSHGRPETRESVNHTQNNQRSPSKRNNEIPQSRPTSRDLANQKTKTPHSTPRETNATNEVDSVTDVLKSVLPDDNAVPGEEDMFDSILDEDELFMALSPKDREEWEKMMGEREQLLEDSKERHQNWSDSFTRRRMFALTRMRKLKLTYQDRLKMFSNLSNTINRAVSRKPTEDTTKQKPIAKRMSEPSLKSKHEPPVSLPTNKILKHSQSSGGIEIKPDHKSSKVPNGDGKSGKSSSMDVVCTVEQVT